MDGEELELYRRAEALEAKKRESGGKLDRAKERSAARLDGMADKVWNAIEMALESEDESVRLKAALAMADRLVPKVGVDRGEKEEVVEVIPDSRKRLLEDIEFELKKQQERKEATDE